MNTLLTIQQAAIKLNIPVRTLEDKRYRQRNKIPVTKAGKLVRFSEPALEKWILKRSVTA